MELSEEQIVFKKSFKGLQLGNNRELSLEELEGRASEFNLFFEKLLQRPPLSPEQLREVVASLTQELSITLTPSGTVFDPETFEPWLIDRKTTTPTPRWDAYKALLVERDWEAPVIDDLEKQSDEVVELMGDPLKSGSWIRRGLLMGEVQSGKTANYIAVLNKAMDYGYKVIIVIGGHTNDLRKQTQARIDSDLLGIDSEYVDDNISNSSLKKTGIGLINGTLRAHLMTTVRGDFNSQRKTAGVTWIDSGIPTVFVIKKNARLIANVANYIKLQSNGNKLDIPLAVIDDEADWGTPNTGSDTDPTKVNKEIRKLLETSDKSTYLGITATPFANIFIDDQIQDPEHGKDLFPSDYIRVLSAPSTYSGISKYFTPKHDGIRLDVDDCLEIIPIVHKRDLKISELPDSLRSAVTSFVIGTAIRRQRSRKAKAASMLVNVSRFNDVQAQVHKLTDDYLSSLKALILAEFSRSATKTSGHFDAFKKVWDVEFKDAEGADWGKVRTLLPEIIEEFKVELVNSQTAKERNRSRKLLSDEQRLAEDLRPTIFVGGDVLSRGLTLEGLQVSYFVREPRTMDTLMQMGRWFGYRPGYMDLVRVWLPEDTAEDFEWSAATTEELRDLLLEMRSRNLTPKSFGLRVRTHPEGFRIVAANKSKATEQIFEGAIVWENRLLESNKLPADEHLLERNLDALREFVQDLDGLCTKGIVTFATSRSNYPSWEGVPLALVQDFFTKFKAPIQCDNFGPGLSGTPSLAFESLSEVKNSETWDISIVNGQGDEYELDGVLKPRLTVRNEIRFDKGDRILQFSNRRVASSQNLSGALSQIEFNKMKPSEPGDLTQKDVLGQLERPRLLLYLVEVKKREEGSEWVADGKLKSVATNCLPLVAVAIAYPKLDAEEAIRKAERSKRYTGNTVYLRNRFGGFDDGDDLDFGDEDD